MQVYTTDSVWNVFKPLKVKKKGQEEKKKELGLTRESNSEPLAPKARIIPLDQRASDHVDKVAIRPIYLSFGGGCRVCGSAQAVHGLSRTRLLMGVVCGRTHEGECR